MIELLEIEHECMLRGAHDDCDRNCADCELVQDDGDLHEMYTNVISLLKEQDELLRKLQKDKDKLCLEVSEWKHKFHDRPLKDAVEPKVSSTEQRCGNCNKVIEMDGWIACPWCGKPIAWNEWWNKNG